MACIHGTHLTAPKNGDVFGGHDCGVGAVVQRVDVGSSSEHLWAFISFKSGRKQTGLHLFSVEGRAQHSKWHDP